MSTSISANLTTPTFFGKYLNISCRPWWSVDTPPKRRFTYWNTNIYHNIGWKCIHSPTIIAEFQWFTTLEVLSELGAVPFNYLHLLSFIYHYLWWCLCEVVKIHAGLVGVFNPSGIIDAWYHKSIRLTYPWLHLCCHTVQSSWFLLKHRRFCRWNHGVAWFKPSLYDSWLNNHCSCWTPRFDA